MNIEHKNATDGTASATAPQNFDPYKFEERVIDGVKVIYKNIDWVDVIQFRLAIDRGAESDPEGKGGSAHFLEHVLFTGNPIYQDKKAIQAFSKKHLLDTLNAYTSFYETVVTCRFLEKYSSEALNGLFALAYQPLLRDEDIETERKIITQEMWKLLSNEKKIAYHKRTRNNLYRALPKLARMASPGGWIDTVQDIDKNDIEEVFKSYNQENTTIFLAGKITDKTWGILEEFINKIPHGEKIIHPAAPKEIPCVEEKFLKIDYESAGMTPSEQATLTIVKIIPKGKFTEDQLLAASSILGELLHRRIRIENSWCYHIGANFGINPRNDRQIISTNLSPENINDALNIIWDTIDKLIKGEYRDDFEKEKIVSIDRTLAQEHTTDSMIEFAIDDHYYNSKVHTRAELIKRIENIKYEDIVPVFKEFNKETVYLETVVPKKFL